MGVIYNVIAHLWAALMTMGKPEGAASLIAALPRPDPSMTQRVAIVTGSNTGIGLETARRLAVDYGMTVVLACRSRGKGEQAVQEIQRQGGKGAIFLQPLDLSMTTCQWCM